MPIAHVGPSRLPIYYEQFKPANHATPARAPPTTTAPPSPFTGPFVADNAAERGWQEKNAALEMSSSLRAVNVKAAGSASEQEHRQELLETSNLPHLNPPRLIICPGLGARAKSRWILHIVHHLTSVGVEVVTYDGRWVAFLLMLWWDGAYWCA
jgi:hypothetical protein